MPGSTPLCLRVISDTNTAVSAILREFSVPALAFRLMFERDQALLSPQMRSELFDVFSREKFNRYTTLEERMLFLAKYLKHALPVHSVVTITDCIDPKDNMILECALAGAADVIVTGDDHLLRLHPWRGIAILKPQDYLALRAAPVYP